MTRAWPTNAEHKETDSAAYIKRWPSLCAQTWVSSPSKSWNDQCSKTAI